MLGLVLFRYSGFDACLSCRGLCYSGIVVMTLACLVGACGLVVRSGIQVSNKLFLLYSF